MIESLTTRTKSLTTRTPCLFIRGPGRVFQPNKKDVENFVTLSLFRLTQDIDVKFEGKYVRRSRVFTYPIQIILIFEST